MGFGSTFLKTHNGALGMIINSESQNTEKNKIYKKKLQEKSRKKCNKIWDKYTHHNKDYMYESNHQGMHKNLE